MTNGKKSAMKRERFATAQDIKQLTDAIDRIRDDNTRYLVCMMVDTITQHIVDQENSATETIEVGYPLAN